MTPPQPPSQTLRELMAALESRSRQFHAIEQDRTGAFVGMHGSWGGRVYTNWRECPAHPCTADRELIDNALAALAAQEVSQLDKSFHDLMNYQTPVEEASPQPDLARAFEAGWKAATDTCQWADRGRRARETAFAAYLAACRQEQP